MVCDNCLHSKACEFEKAARQMAQELSIVTDYPLAIDISCKRFFARYVTTTFNAADESSNIILNKTNSNWHCPIIEDTFIC